MVNALKKGMMAKIAAKKIQRLKCPPVPVRTGIAAKTANALKKVMMVRTAAKMRKSININLSNCLI